MDLLLDTHVFLWWDGDDARLNAAARAAIADRSNRVFVSVASIWEICIKRQKGKLLFPGAPSVAIDRNGFGTLSIGVDHAEAAGDLSWHHPDPFDRMILCQAKLLSCVLVTADSILASYKPVPQLWAA
jgi:PIN domain nuclease of toxin-antitoxin system